MFNWVLNTSLLSMIASSQIITSLILNNVLNPFTAALSFSKMLSPSLMLSSSLMLSPSLSQMENDSKLIINRASSIASSSNMRHMFWFCTFVAPSNIKHIYSKTTGQNHQDKTYALYVIFSQVHLQVKATPYCMISFWASWLILRLAVDFIDQLFGILSIMQA